jgi:hypothetical protein
VAENENPAPESGEPHSNEPKSSEAASAKAAPIPPNWAPNMMLYSDISRMLFRMHRNVSAHMDAQKRLTERMQSVFSHEQAMVLELARLIDESLTVATRKSNESKPAPGPDSLERIFDHASKAMQETGRMMTEIQLESLALLQHYVEESTSGVIKPNDGPDAKKGNDKA